MTDYVPQVPLIETYPVLGDAGSITLQAGGLSTTSRLLGDQGRQVTALSTELAPAWNGEAATGYQALSSKVAGAFSAAASKIEGAAALLIKYAEELSRLQREASAAAQESEHWHEQIVTWTGKLSAAQTARTKAQTALTTAQGDYTTAVAEGPKGAGRAAAASAAIAAAQGQVRTATTDITTARTRLRTAHEQFTHWQERARKIHVDAKMAGEEAAAGLLIITVIPPPLPGAPDYPALEPTPGFLLNNDGGDDGDGGKGQGDDGDGGNGQGDDGEKGKDGERGTDGEKKPPVVVVGPDGKIVQPEKPKTTATIGDRREAQDKAARQYEQDTQQPNVPTWVKIMDVISHFFPHPPHHPGG